MRRMLLTGVIALSFTMGSVAHAEYTEQQISLLDRFTLQLRGLAMVVTAYTSNIFGEVLGTKSVATPVQTSEIVVDNDREAQGRAPLSLGVLKDRQSPLEMAFKPFTNVPFDLGKNPSEHQNVITSLTDVPWIHTGGGVTQSSYARNKDIAARVRSGSWDIDGKKKILTLQEAYGGVGSTYWKQLWPGHVLYTTGTKMVSMSSVPDAQGRYLLTVADPRVIASSQAQIDKINTNPNRPGVGGHHIITLYNLTSENKPDWKSAEYVKVVDMSETGATTVFSIERESWRKSLGIQGSNKSFIPGRAVVAVPMRYWSGQLQLNFSLDGPKLDEYAHATVNDPLIPAPIKGERAAEWYARVVAQNVISVGASGVEFDVARWTFGRQNASIAMDVNNDLVTDHGYINGINSFGLGTRIFHKKLRELLGPDRIIQVDSSWAGGGTRDWQYLNGAQLEAFPSKNDPNRFSEAFRHLMSWKKNAAIVDGASIGPRASYPALKIPTSAYNPCNTERTLGLIVRITDPDCNSAKYSQLNSRFRTGVAAATLLEFPSSYSMISTVDYDPYSEESNAKTSEIFSVFTWDEFRKGNENKSGWLGGAVGPLTRVAELGAELPATWEVQIDNGYEARPGGLGADVTRVPAPTRITPNEGWFGVKILTTKPVRFTPGREYTISFWARGDTTWQYGGDTIKNVPRLLALNVPMRSNAEEPVALLITDKWQLYRFSFVAADCELATEAHYCPKGKMPAFGISEQMGLTELRDIKIQEGTGERYYREFEHGIVLLNMSILPWRADLPHSTSTGYKRLSGVTDPVINNGASVGKTIVVPARDALFLVKTSNPSRESGTTFSSPK